MKELKCPKCGQMFKVDETGMAEIVKQVHDHEFERELAERLKNATEMAAMKAEGRLKDELARKDAEVLALKAKIENAGTEKKLAVSEAVTEIERERDRLANDLKTKDAERKLAENNLREKFALELKSKDETIAFYKDMKAKMSTKMVGESLEQHCEIEFEKLRATGFHNAEFGKDNDAKSGSKGDYIYREFDENGTEIISIMFEMKNENDETATKKKNEDFLKELDKDRHEKKCEYAVLVSMLESESELYNSGIVDKSHRFEKMYVIRPQFFIPMITILRNAAQNAMAYKAELALVRAQNVDVTDFEERIEKWKTSFAVNSDRATKNFAKAIKEIEESIKRLENTRDALVQTVRNFEVANGKLDDLTVKKLTRGNETMKAKFEELAGRGE